MTARTWTVTWTQEFVAEDAFGAGVQAAEFVHDTDNRLVFEVHTEHSVTIGPAERVWYNPDTNRRHNNGCGAVQAVGCVMVLESDPRLQSARGCQRCGRSAGSNWRIYPKKEAA